MTGGAPWAAARSSRARATSSGAEPSAVPTPPTMPANATNKRPEPNVLFMEFLRVCAPWPHPCPLSLREQRTKCLLKFQHYAEYSADDSVCQEGPWRHYGRPIRAPVWKESANDGHRPGPGPRVAVAARQRLSGPGAHFWILVVECLDQRRLRRVAPDLPYRPHRGFPDLGR